MGTIKSGASPDVLTIDGTRMRASRYDSAGREVSAQGKRTYRAQIDPFTPVANATDMIRLRGSTTTTVRLKSFVIEAEATAATQVEFFLIKRSTTDGPTGATKPTAFYAFDSNADLMLPPALQCAYWTTLPSSLGAAVGTVGRYDVLLPADTGSRLVMELIPWVAREYQTQNFTLRGQAEGLYLNFNAAAVPAGMLVSATILWTEE